MWTAPKIQEDPLPCIGKIARCPLWVASVKRDISKTGPQAFIKFYNKSILKSIKLQKIEMQQAVKIIPL